MKGPNLNKELIDALNGKSGYVAKTYAEYDRENIEELTFLKSDKEKEVIARAKRKEKTLKWLDKKRKEMAKKRKEEVERRRAEMKKK